MNGLNFLLEDEALLTIRPKNRQSGLLYFDAEGFGRIQFLSLWMSCRCFSLHWDLASSRCEDRGSCETGSSSFTFAWHHIGGFLAFAGWVGQEQEELKVEVETESKDAKIFRFLAPSMSMALSWKIVMADSN